MPSFAGELFYGSDQTAVVRRDARIVAVQQQLFRKIEILRANVGHLSQRDLGRFVVGAFAEPNARLARDCLVDVGRRALQVGLQHFADVFVLRERLAEDAQRGLGDRRSLHVDSHERIGIAQRVLRKGDQALFGERFVEEQAHRGELHRDVRGDAALADGVEHLEVRVARTQRAVTREDVFAEEIQRRGHSLGVERANDLERAGDRLARHEAAREEVELLLEHGAACSGA